MVLIIIVHKLLAVLSEKLILFDFVKTIYRSCYSSPQGYIHSNITAEQQLHNHSLKNADDPISSFDPNSDHLRNANFIFVINTDKSGITVQFVWTHKVSFSITHNF